MKVKDLLDEEVMHADRAMHQRFKELTWTRKPASWIDIDDRPATKQTDPAAFQYIKTLDHYTVSDLWNDLAHEPKPTDRFHVPEETLPQYFVLTVDSEEYLVNTEDFDYVRNACQIEEA